MRRHTEIYKPRKTLGLPALFVPILLIGPLLNNLVPLRARLIGGGILILLSGGIAAAPLGAKLEVGEDFVKSTFFGIVMSNISAKDVIAVEHGQLFRGGLGPGKGLRIVVEANGKRKTYTIGELFFGGNAIAHAKRVLEPRDHQRTAV